MSAIASSRFVSICTFVLVKQVKCASVLVLLCTRLAFVYVGHSKLQILIPLGVVRALANLSIVFNMYSKIVKALWVFVVLWCVVFQTFVLRRSLPPYLTMQ
jgi:hypothetical protein